MSSIKGVAMKLDFDPNTKRVIADMSKKEAWALLETLDCIVLDRKPICIAKEYKRAFISMKNKEDKRMIKKLGWEKPELVEICPLETKGIVRCEDICTGGDNARYVCQKGCEHR